MQCGKNPNKQVLQYVIINPFVDKEAWFLVVSFLHKDGLSYSQYMKG